MQKRKKEVRIMPVRIASAFWEGTLKEGHGKMILGSGDFEGIYSFSSRFEEGKGTNPEELIGAAHAGCFSMALAHGLAQAGYSPKRIYTTAKVNLAKTKEGFKITDIKLITEAKVPEIKEDVFIQQAEDAKKNCPVSKALTGTEIKLEAKLSG
jgi:osmotically inducible protein OsmC